MQNVQNVWSIFNHLRGLCLLPRYEKDYLVLHQPHIFEYHKNLFVYYVTGFTIIEGNTLSLGSHNTFKEPFPLFEFF